MHHVSNAEHLLPHLCPLHQQDIAHAIQVKLEGHCYINSIVCLPKVAGIDTKSVH